MRLWMVVADVLFGCKLWRKEVMAMVFWLLKEMVSREEERLRKKVKIRVNI